MKILIFAGVSPNTFVYMMDEAELYYRLGHEVLFRVLRSASGNMLGEYETQPHEV